MLIELGNSFIAKFDDFYAQKVPEEARNATLSWNLVKIQG